MKNLKIRLLLVFVIVVFAVLNVSAAGTAEIINFTAYPNCNNTGTIFSYTLVYTAFSGSLSLRFYIDGALVQTLGEGTFGSPVTVSLPTSRDGSIVGSPNPDHSVYQLVLVTNGSTAFDYSWDCTTGLQVITPSPTSPDSDTNATPIIPAFSDGRLNRYDAAAPVALFLHEEGLAIYVIDERSEGTLAFLLSFEDIEAVGIPDENTLLGTSEDGLIALWRLPNGQFMLQAPTVSGKTYYLFFDSIGEQMGYISYES